MVTAQKRRRRNVERSSEEAALILTECQSDPMFFVREVLGLPALDTELMLNGLTEDEEAILLAVRDHKRVAVRACNNVGKTLTAAVVVLWFGFAFQPCKIITTATVARQVRAQIWSEVPRLFYGAPYNLGGKVSKTGWEISEDSFAIGFSTNEVDRFQGWHAPHILFVLDEASGLSQAIFDGVEGSMGGEHARVLVLGNPLRASGPFYQCFRSSEWVGLKMSAERHPNVVRGREVIPGGISQSWMDGRLADWGRNDPRYIARVLGEFPESAEDVLIPTPWVEAAMERPVPPREGRLRLGVDVARFGDDRTVFVLRDDVAVRAVEVHEKEDLMQTTGRIVNAIETHGIKASDVAIDDTGLGGGVTDRLRELHYAVQAVNFGSRARQSDQYANMRTELHWAMRAALDPAGDRPLAIPREFEALARECSAPRYTYTSKGLLALEEKKHIKARLGRSPDLADAFALTWATQRETVEAWVG